MSNRASSRPYSNTRLGSWSYTDNSSTEPVGFQPIFSANRRARGESSGTQPASRPMPALRASSSIRDTIAAAYGAGADTFVSGSALFGANDPKSEVNELRNCCYTRV